MKQCFKIIILTYVLMSCSPKNFYPSYKTLESFKISDFDGEVVQLTHKKSGARLVLMKNKDQARSFTAVFRTPPYDDTGLFHIFEHAVLAGSRLYPSKSNFFNVASSSVASFINAMTTDISTLYPFITRDPKDFDNLLSVYMDAVFFPEATKDPRIMKREGWRYEIHLKTKKLSLNGIVFSEMKGNFSSPYWLLLFNLGRFFLPQTPYAYESGGFPEQIASLRFEQIVEAHKKYYRPQNSLIFLYGDIDFKKTLATIDKKFLSHFNKNKNFKSPEIPRQKGFKDSDPPVVKTSYPGSKGDNKDFVAKGYLLDKFSLLEENALSVLLNAFASNPVAPLKLRILNEKLASSVFYQSLGRENNALAFVFEGTEAKKRESLEIIFQEELNKVIRQGLDQELVTSVLNKYEFLYKEKGNANHKGLFWIWTVKKSWLYPNRPLVEELDFIGQFKKLREFLSDESYVKKFFKKHFKDNKRFRWLVMQPDPLFSKKFNKILEERITKALKLKPLREYEKEDKVYRQWVSAKEPTEVTNKTPLLKLSNLKADEKPIPFKKSKIGASEIMEYSQEANGISYINFFFDLRGLKEKNLKNLALFTNLLKKTNTDNYSFQELQKQIDTSIGNISFYTEIYQSFKNTKEFKPFIRVSLHFLNENREKSMELLKEILAHSQFAPVDRVQNLLNEMKVDMSNSIPWRARRLVTQSAQKSFFPAQGSFLDETRGGIFIKYLLRSKMDFQQLIPQFQLMLKNIFNQNRLSLVTITADQKELRKLKAKVTKLKKSLPAQGLKDQKWAFSNQKSYQGYVIPGEVQYLAETTSLKDQGLDYSGSLLVYSNYLDNHFLHPQIREQAGAYAAWSSVKRNGLLTMNTFRDPNLEKSFDIFSRSVDFMKNESLDQEKLKAAILDSLKRFYADRSVSRKEGLMTSLYLSDLSWKDYIKIKKEILKTSPASFRKINQALALALKKSKKAAAGNPNTLKKEAPFLKEVLTLP